MLSTRSKPVGGSREFVESVLSKSQLNLFRKRGSIHINLGIRWIGGVGSVMDLDWRKLADQDFFRCSIFSYLEVGEHGRVIFLRSCLEKLLHCCQIYWGVYHPYRSIGRERAQPISECSIDDKNYLVRLGAHVRHPNTATGYALGTDNSLRFYGTLSCVIIFFPSFTPSGISICGRASGEDIVRNKDGTAVLMPGRSI